MTENNKNQNALSRRAVIGKSLAIAGAAGGALSGARALAADAPKRGVKKGNINQSVVFWCFHVAGGKWDIEKTCQVTKELGGKSVELCEPDAWPTLKKYGLECAIAPNGMSGPPFVKGINNPRYQEEVIAATKKSIDACSDAGVKKVIAFTGFKYKDAEDPKSGEISLEEGAANCVKALVELGAYGAKKGVTVCLEHLNTRDDTHPMKGHPGYQGDDLDYCAEIVKAAGSEHVKLLFDIYHVQVMNGDVIRRLGQYKDIIGHVHTAGNPGRAELDDTQEIHYVGAMKKLVEIGYTGYVGQEFIPTRDAYTSLAEAMELCDV
jgi:hydroxypyruvate isomerase